MAEEKSKLSKKVIRKAYWDWMFFNLSVQNFERMEGPGIVRMLGQVKDDLYPNDKKAQQEMLQRHTIFFNTEPYLGCIVPGIVLGMEGEKADGGEVDEEFINSIKTALMGPFAGIGDSLLPGTLIPILLSIGMGLCKNGEIIGPLFYVIAFLGSMFPITWLLFSYGAKTGANAAQTVLESGIKDKVTNAAGIIGLVTVGAITASYANIKIGLVYAAGEMTVNVGEIIEGLFPKMPVLIMAFITYHLMVNKKWSVGKMMLLFLILSIVGYFTKILVL
ncbi:PTS system mannose/fructose/sorbose family transporter subunit IID [Clostridium sp.]|uniref:PTS system mannose/fructose/sorbose family transporter subunit IID n=1 Tax=Clostridium sp. TaxID=1506 RepID=UPI0029153FBC|nr:PTS system mannose/fructose/sorbose family transporter subunit IID [Clostridium sp.]MDU5107847.1 PTS system mannose/fructose/sorbose family transporter subunit IID [Clostridium sp.]